MLDIILFLKRSDRILIEEGRETKMGLLELLEDLSDGGDVRMTLNI